MESDKILTTSLARFHHVINLSVLQSPTGYSDTRVRRVLMCGSRGEAGVGGGGGKVGVAEAATAAD